jgi:hypothetical protein
MAEAKGKQKTEKSLEEEARVMVATVFAGKLPTNEGLVKAACERHPGESAETLLSFKVYPTKVVIVISTGQKYEYELIDLLKQLTQKIAGKGAEPGEAVQPANSRKK